ncbi:MAG TPA: GNAT family N-acetyltransferase [Pyrinomonadaceae bacterium]|nr:GNAT family N-acetyltransferase [Pyrinomonadaceae bacterium]HMP65871.1 GNAT family N-acetyltransferase [Pyrinomonadaceae bacterium]
MEKNKCNILIREAGSDDAKLLCALQTVTFYEAYFEQDSPEDMANYLHEMFNPERVRLELEDKDASFYVMCRDGVAVGYAKLVRHSRADGVSQGRTVELKRIYLVERVWRQGLGQALLDHCIGVAMGEGFESLWLGVWERNERAKGFYLKNGFERVGTIEFPYGDTVGINWVMEKRLYSI